MPPSQDVDAHHPFWRPGTPAAAGLKDHPEMIQAVPGTSMFSETMTMTLTMLDPDLVICGHSSSWAVSREPRRPGAQPWWLRVGPCPAVERTHGLFCEQTQARP
ncbi:hypothetical protein EI555_000430 [Monodon monoceros]|uniref:Uncharacterized protein n=1 Tax=Monodon monoceros TaxID=40151 RepID=A0A4U1EY56_MONMO|nr:hypothetical protein EI555_000430 [Monodon monoceros]